MRVLFVVDTLGAGGAERSLQELLQPLFAAGVSPIIACFERRADGVEHLVSALDMRVLPGRGKSGQMAALRRIGRDESIDLVHTTLFQADVFGRSSFLGLGLPIVTSLVNMPYEPARLQNDPNVNKTKLALARGLEIVTGRLCATHFHAITAAVKRSATERLHIPPRKITVVHRGRDSKRLGRRTQERRRSMRERLGIAESTFVVLSAARQEFQKGQRYLLQALPRLLAERPDSLLVIAGRAGSASAELMQLAGPLGERVRFLGHRDDVPELMVAADAFALPSLWEGLGCVLIEALALELPIVASSLEPIREVVEHRSSALLVPPQEHAPLAEALLEIAGNNGAAAELTRTGRALFERAFTLERSAQGMLALFEKAIAERRGARK